MIFIALGLVAIVIALLRGGQLTRLAYLPVRHSYLIIAGLLLQILIFSPWWRQTMGTALVPHLYVLSMGIVFAALILNFRLPGMALITLGLCLNLLAITANGGYMPASPDALRTAGFGERLTSADATVQNNSSVIDEHTRLWLLADVFAIPADFPLANVFSIGDVLLALGAAHLVYATMTDVTRGAEEDTFDLPEDPPGAHE